MPHEPYPFADTMSRSLAGKRMGLEQSPPICCCESTMASAILKENLSAESQPNPLPAEAVSATFQRNSSPNPVSCPILRLGITAVQRGPPWPRACWPNNSRKNACALFLIIRPEQRMPMRMYAFPLKVLAIRHIGQRRYYEEWRKDETAAARS